MKQGKYSETRLLKTRRTYLAQTLHVWDGELNYFLFKEESFDRNENKIKEIQFAGPGKTETTQKWAYTSGGLLLSEEIFFEEAQSSVKKHFHLGEEGILLQTETVYEDGEREFELYERAPGFQKIIKINAEDQLESSIEFYYNDYHKVVLEKHFDSDGHLIYLKKNEYDVAQNLLRTEEEDKVNHETIFTEYLYDHQSRQIRKQVARRSGDILELEEKTYQNELLVEVKTLSGKECNSYDKEGNAVKIERYDFKDQPTGYEKLSYDTNGRLLSQTIYQSGGSFMLEPGLQGSTKSHTEHYRFEYDYYEPKEE